MNAILYVLPVMLIATSCKTKDSMEIEILSRELIPKVTSGSGLVTSKDGFYIIGDDSPFLFHIDRRNQIISKSQIYSTENLGDGRISKKLKPDFEGLERISETEMVAIGSGSKSPERDIFLRVFLSDTIQATTYNITPCYDNLRKLKIMENAALNIEAIAFLDGNLYLFNRGRNVVFRFVYEDLIAFFEDSIPFPEPVSILFHLPEIDGIESGFSGAAIIKDGPFIIFTSSVEDTENPYDDGEILGSFIGVIDVSDGKISTEYRSIIIPHTSDVLKVESITIENKLAAGKIKIALVTDDDKGNSMKIDCLLTL